MTPRFQSISSRLSATSSEVRRPVQKANWNKFLPWSVIASRNVRLKEIVPQHIVDEVLARIEAILFE